ncbi:MAG: ATP-grasp domain-containing protein [Bifidobacteriaceae bacterium]|jgi:hypothetical protein|nr:ATP-grasp domain-containing protein [Bifidobacteriaceae bacterium]
MTSEREDLCAAISRALDGRQLLWMGIRGDDARALAEIPEFAGSFSIINRYSHRPLDYSMAYEDITGVRVDLDDWDIDAHPFDEATAEFRHQIRVAMAKDSAVVTYRPSEFLSALVFSRADRCRYLGLYASHHHAFEHKPWVEVAVAKMGIPTLGWRYVADEEQLDVPMLLGAGPVVVRPSRGSGGTGITKAEGIAELVRSWPHGEEFFASVSPYLDGCISMNVGAVVWDDGVTIHHPSVQLIGIPGCTRREFGYCGNDFAAVKQMGNTVIRQMEHQTRRIGDWARSQGYRGAFGVDFMVQGDRLLFTEMNPRMQGSTRLSSRLSALSEQPCILLDHVAALLHLSTPIRPSLPELVDMAPDAAQVMLHNLSGAPAPLRPAHITARVLEIAPDSIIELAPSHDLFAAPDSTMAAARFPRSVTETGHSLDSRLATALAEQATQQQEGDQHA